MANGLKFGLFSMNVDACSYLASSIAVARAAEAMGFDALWAGEHVVLPDPQLPPSPMAPGDRILDPIVALTFLAAHTSRVLLGTGVIILPQRNPLVQAKELASLDVFSGGRLLVGIGVGYLEPEFRAVGVPFPNRGARTIEDLAAMRVIWSEKQPVYDGQFVTFTGVQAQPWPTQHPHPPIVMGGHLRPAYRRAIEDASGWYGLNLDLESTAQHLAGLRDAAQTRRGQGLGQLEVSLTPREPIDRETARRFADLGVDRLILMPPRDLERAALLQFVERVGTELIGTI